jgi:hypothetical protein
MDLVLTAILAEGPAAGFQGRKFVRTSGDVVGLDPNGMADSVEINFGDGVNGL